MFDITAFRLHFPEFSDPVAYPDGIITYRSGFATKYISQNILGDAYDYAWDLLTAHFIVLSKKNEVVAASGGIPGGDAGAISSKQTGSASVSYDGQTSSEEKAGHFNQTTYGREYINIIRLCAPHSYQL